MSAESPAQVLEQYRRGLDAELTLLRRLHECARRQHSASAAGDIESVHRANDERDRLMAGLVAIEQQVSPVRDALRGMRQHAQRLSAFHEVAALHAEVGRMIAATLDTDRTSIEALQQIVSARRIAAEALEQGESTLAAYGRLATPPPAATLVNRRG